MNSTFTSVIIPAFNEASRIQPTLLKILHYLAENFSRFEIIVVNDGSTDGTADQIAEVAVTDERIVTISMPINHGKGFAVRQGMLTAKGDWLIFTDADLSTPVEAIPTALAAGAEGFPVVIGSRRHPNSIIERHQSRSREAMGKCFNQFMRALLFLPYQDTQCGFKCFELGAAREIFGRARLDGFVFDVEILVIARRLGYAVKEIPVCWTDAPGSKVRFHETFLTIFKELFTIWYYDWRGHYRNPPTPR